MVVFELPLVSSESFGTVCVKLAVLSWDEVLLTVTVMSIVALAPAFRSEIVQVTVWPLTFTHEFIEQFDADEETKVRPAGSTSVTTTWPEAAVLSAALAAVSVSVSSVPTSESPLASALLSDTSAHAGVSVSVFEVPLVPPVEFGKLCVKLALSEA